MTSLALTVTQELDFDALLPLTRGFFDLARVVVRAAVRCAHRVEAYVGTVDVTHTPVDADSDLLLTIYPQPED